MCQTEVISHSIASLSKRSFAQRLDLISHSSTRIKGALTRLNNRLDALYEQLYDAYPHITEADYQALKPYLTVLISTLKDLSLSYTGCTPSLKENVLRLQMNISAIEEIDSDIQNFRINIFRNPRYKEVVERTKSFCV